MTEEELKRKKIEILHDFKRIAQEVKKFIQCFDKLHKDIEEILDGK